MGRLGKSPAAFLPRHGEHHGILPSEINYRANIWALKEAGARMVVSVSATGSLRQELTPGTLVLASQYIDLTKGLRKQTYLGEGLVAHVSTAEPTCAVLSDAIAAAALDAGITVHRGKTYVCVEGPRFGTKAESHWLRQMGGDIVGMTNLPEAWLAREAQLSYVTLAVATDYDCWMEDPDQHATLDAVLAQYKKSLGDVQKILRALLSAGLPDVSGSPARHSMKQAVMTPAEHIPAAKKKLLEFLQQ
jgi:5'-methylthioadenosine phosphorylase